MRAFGGVRAAVAVFVSLLVRCDQASACAAFDRHVADGHAAFHRQIADRFAAILDDVAGAAGCAGSANDGHGDVFGGHTGGKFAGDLDLHVFGFLLDQRLRGQNVLDLGCADAVGQAPNAPWVAVWLSPHTTVMPGRVQPCSGPTMCTMP